MEAFIQVDAWGRRGVAIDYSAAGTDCKLFAATWRTAHPPADVSHGDVAIRLKRLPTW